MTSLVDKNKHMLYNGKIFAEATGDVFRVHINWCLSG